MGFEAGDANVSRYVGNGVTTASDATGLQEGKTHEQLVEEMMKLLPAPVTTGTHTCSNTVDQYVEKLNALPINENLPFTGYRRVDFRISLKPGFPIGYGYVIVYFGLTTGHAALEVDLKDGATILIDNGGLTGDLVTNKENVPPWFERRIGPETPIVNGVVDSPFTQDLKASYRDNLLAKSNRHWWGPHGKF